jgi:uncharacterized cupredoxin-like copper-binding protein
MGVMKHHVRAVRVLVASVLLIALATACSKEEETAPPPAATSAAGPSKVEVTLQEFAVGTVPATAASGSVTFDIKNNGPDDEHEFVIFRTDLDPTALPTVATGAVDEEGAGIELVDEQEAIPPQEERDLTVTLTPGKYVLICNIYDEAEKESHYQKGMRTAFTVT